MILSPRVKATIYSTSYWQHLRVFLLIKLTSIRERAEQVRHRLLAGEDFAQLAKTTSDLARKQGAI